MKTIFQFLVMEIPQPHSIIINTLLTQSIYGLKQVTNPWYQHFAFYLLKLGLCRYLFTGVAMT